MSDFDVDLDGIEDSGHAANFYNPSKGTGSGGSDTGGNTGDTGAPGSASSFDEAQTQNLIYTALKPLLEDIKGLKVKLGECINQNIFSRLFDESYKSSINADLPVIMDLVDSRFVSKDEYYISVNHLFNQICRIENDVTACDKLSYKFCLETTGKVNSDSCDIWPH